MSKHLFHCGWNSTHYSFSSQSDTLHHTELWDRNFIKMKRNLEILCSDPQFTVSEISSQTSTRLPVTLRQLNLTSVNLWYKMMAGHSDRLNPTSVNLWYKMMAGHSDRLNPTSVNLWYKMITSHSDRLNPTSVNLSVIWSAVVQVFWLDRKIRSQRSNKVDG